MSTTIAVASDAGIDQDISIKVDVEVCPVCGGRALYGDTVEQHIMLGPNERATGVVFHNPHHDVNDFCEIE